MIAVYDYHDAGAVRKAIHEFPQDIVADIAGKSVKDLKAGTAEAQAGMAG